MLLSLVGFVIALIALIRGHLRWARIPNRRVGLFVLLGSLVVFVIGGALLPSPPPTTPAAGTATSTDASPTPSPTDTSAPTGPVPGAPADVQGPYQVSEVIDGDTYRITRPEGTSTVRLIGIDTPETKHPDRPVECFGKEATQAAQQLLDSQTVWVHDDPTQDAQDRYGRQLVYLWLADGTLVNEKLIRDGFAIEYTYEKPYQQQDAFRAAQDEARQASRGLWAATTCNGNPHLPAQQPTKKTPTTPNKPAPSPQKSQTPAAPSRPAPPPQNTKAPAHPPPPPTKPGPTTPPTGGNAVYYKNCAAARAAGAAPIHRGQPGYRSELDRDNDGVACERR